MVMVCSTNRGKEDCILEISVKARRNETTEKTKTQVDG